MVDVPRVARFRWTIKRKLLALGAGTLIPIALLLAYWLRAEIRHATRDAEARLELAGGQAAVQVDLLLADVRGHVESLARHPAIRSGPRETIEQALGEVVAGHIELEGLLVVDAEGHGRASVVREAVGVPVSVSDRAWFREVRASRRPVVSGFQVGRVTGHPVAVLAAPLGRPGEAFEGAVSAGLSLQRLHTLFAPLPLSGGIAITVVDADGRILARAPAGGRNRLGQPLPSFAALARSGRTVSAFAWFDGTDHLASVATVPGTGWRVVASAPRALVQGRIERQMREVGLPLLLLLCVAAAVGLVIARKVWRPLEALRAAVTRFPREERLAVGVDSSDEVGDLARAFDEMTVQVGTAQSALQRRVGELEALSEAGQLLTSTLELSQVLQRLAELARARLEADVARIWLRQGDSNEYRLHAQAGVAANADEVRIHLEPGEGLVGSIMARREPLLLAHMQDDLRLVNREWARAGDFHGFLGVPIVLEDTPVGVLACMRRGPRPFSDDEVRLAQFLALPAAIAILNARLYDETREQARENAELVTSLRRALDDLAQAQERLAETEALRAVGQLAAGMAHHLNNILAVVRGRAALLLQRVEEPATRRGLEIVERAAVEGAEVVRRLQEFSRAQRVAESARVDMNALVGEVLELTRPRWRDDAERRGIAIEARLDAGEIPHVAASHERLREALVNVIFNALDAMPSGGRIVVRTWASDGRVHCSVTDSGTGMPDDIRRRALEPFFTTKGPKSRGLGLSTCHGIVQRHGGEIRIESRPDHGTTVTISLPAATAASVPEPEGGDRAAPPAVLNILVIDDEAEVREILAESLAAHGHAVTQASSGAEGLALFRAGGHDVVFTDLGMPGMSGAQVADAIKAESRATPVVLVTGWDEEETRAARGRGAWDVVVGKPFDPNALAAVIARACGRRDR